MKKLITILCSFVLCISLFGCQKETKDYIAKIEVKDTFRMLTPYLITTQRMLSFMVSGDRSTT